jgi:hypothetical protein
MEYIITRQVLEAVAEWHPQYFILTLYSLEQSKDNMIRLRLLYSRVCSIRYFRVSRFN